MQRRESGTTRASMSHTIGFLNDLRIFATRCFAGLTLCDSIRKRSKACFIPFFDIDVELFMRTYIGLAVGIRLDYCSNAGGGPLTRFHLRLTLTCTRFAILMKGIPLFMP